MKLKISIVAFFLSAFLIKIYSQEAGELLRNKGYESVLIDSSSGKTNIYFEHREFRSPFHSMKFAKLILKNNGISEADNEINFIPIYRNVPIGIYSAENYSYQPLGFIEKAFFTEHNQPLKNYRWNFRIQPEVISRFGFYSQPFETKFNLNIDTQIFLLPGFSLFTGISIPVTNTLDSQSTNLRPAPTSLNYFSQPLPSHFLSISAGTFYNDRYGLDFQYRYYRMDSNWSFGLESNVTGFYRFNSFNYSNSSLNRIMLVADAEYRLNYENLSVKLSVGRFLYSDTGARLELIKQFGNVDIGLFGTGSTSGATAGFNFAFNLFPGKILRSKAFELRTTDEFRWEYTYNNQDFVGMKYRTGIPKLSDRLRQYKEEFIQDFE